MIGLIAVDMEGDIEKREILKVAAMAIPMELEENSELHASAYN